MSSHQIVIGDSVLYTGDGGVEEFQRAIEEFSEHYNSELPLERVNPITPEQNALITNERANRDSHTETFSIDINSLPANFTETDVMQHYLNTGTSFVQTRARQVNNYKKFSERWKESKKKKISNLEFLDNLV